MLKNNEECPTGRIDPFIISDFDLEKNAYSQSFLNTEKIGFCGQMSNHFDFPYDIYGVSKSDPFSTWDMASIIDYYFSALGQDLITDLEYGLYLTINYVRSFTEYYDQNEVSNNPWLSEFL